MPKRLLEPADIPINLYVHGDDTLHLGEELARAYHKTLARNGHLQAALDGTPPGAIGGASEQEAIAHFVGPFSGSCGRTSLAVLDPKGDLGEASDEIIHAFAGGRVGLLDIPCGAGAATVTLLTTLAELRRQNVVPREPLEVILLGGDISEKSRQLADQMLSEIAPALATQGIRLIHSLQHFDLLCPDSTTGLLHTWMENTRDCRTYFVLTANFSGFLSNEGKIKQAKERLGEVFRWAHQRKAALIWLEPQSTAATNLWATLRKLFTQVLGWFRHAATTGTLTELLSESNLIHPLIPSSRFLVRVSLIKPSRDTPDG